MLHQWSYIRQFVNSKAPTSKLCGNKEARWELIKVSLMCDKYKIEKWGEMSAVIN